jgi:hypothetical protein
LRQVGIGGLDMLPQLCRIHTFQIPHHHSQSWIRAEKRSVLVDEAAGADWSTARHLARIDHGLQAPA